MKVVCDCGSVLVVRDQPPGVPLRCPQCGADLTAPSTSHTAPPPLPTAAAMAPSEPPVPPGPMDPMAQRRKRWTEPPNLPPDPNAPLAPVSIAASPASVSPPPLTDAQRIARAATAPLSMSEPSESLDDDDAIAPPPLPKVLPGVEPSLEGRRAALHLAIALGLIGLFSGVPAVVHLIQHSPIASLLALAMPRWVAFLLLVSGLHVAYAFYVAQLPDWSTVWVVAITMLALATLNSVLLAVTLLGRQDGALVRLLELHDHLRGGRAAGWCFIMLCLSVTLAYCAGRMAARWHAAETARLQALHLIDSP